MASQSCSIPLPPLTLGALSRPCRGRDWLAPTTPGTTVTVFFPTPLVLLTTPPPAPPAPPAAVPPAAAAAAAWAAAATLPLPGAAVAVAVAVLDRVSGRTMLRALSLRLGGPPPLRGLTPVVPVVVLAALVVVAVVVVVVVAGLLSFGGPGSGPRLLGARLDGLRERLVLEVVETDVVVEVSVPPLGRAL
ncbi:8548aa0c-8624-4350-94df-dfabaf5e17e3 [Thermothielavioides terrestris]|uniref:8548aa0c-8624-4350-94df-dfabaf5e17e3 n=1 Tax=Thermothielavioides terrestris TaxID=2587410 RepID=A0A446BD54_9PEZI|nr:8548aa0c-8624-4350-94df-dfabaf5e17e3 [Thermothielavioides terrestris]